MQASPNESTLRTRLVAQPNVRFSSVTAMYNECMMSRSDIIRSVAKEFLRENQGFPDGHVISPPGNLRTQMGNVTHQTHIFRSERGAGAKATLPSIFGCRFLSLHGLGFHPSASLPVGMYPCEGWRFIIRRHSFNLDYLA